MNKNHLLNFIEDALSGMDGPYEGLDELRPIAFDLLDHIRRGGSIHDFKITSKDE